MPERARQLDSLAVRLALAFVIVALGSLAIVAGLTLSAASRDVNQLAREEQDEAVQAVTRAAARSYTRAGSWRDADLDNVRALATGVRADVELQDDRGRLVIGFAQTHDSGLIRRAEVRAQGQQVGILAVAFTSARLSSAERHLRDALTRTVVTAAAGAAIFALLVGAFVAKRITRPVGELVRAARAIESGNRAARVGDVRARGELAELAATFDRMAGTLAREDSMRRALVADVAHELRTPLTVLIGNLEVMVDGTIEPTQAQLVSLHDEGIRLTGIVEDLEALASADAAGFSLNLAPVDLATVAARAAQRLTVRFEAASVQLRLDTQPALVRGDAQRLEQVVTNLLTNALKFTPEGGSVTVGVRHDQDHHARLIVADNGVGIDPAERPHVFDRFYRGASTRSVSGSGIGLPVVAELVRLHHGTVELDSEQGRGTRVTVTLPSA